MTLKQNVIDKMNHAMEEVLRSAKKMPADKLTWSVNDAGRTPLNMLQELGVLAPWGAKLLKEREMGPFGEEQFKEYNAAMEALDTLEKCEAAIRAGTEKTAQAINETPDSDWEITVAMPWGDKTLLDIAQFNAWNCDYHLGQINFIQTLYGDKDM